MSQPFRLAFLGVDHPHGAAWRESLFQLGGEVEFTALVPEFPGSIGLVRILLWQVVFHTYGSHYMLVGLTVASSLIGVVTFGTFAGSLLPFILRRLGFDPASASAPFVATLVDVTGLIIYFTTASLIMRGTLL